MKRLVRTKRLVAGLMVLALVSGCAAPRPKPPVTPSIPPPAAEAPPPPAPEQPPGLPSVMSVGPRTVPPAAAPAPEPAAPPPPAPPPPTAPPVPPAQRGRIVVLTPDPNRTTDEIITQIVPIRYSSVADLSALLRPLISARGTLIAHRETNVLIVTDSASNVTRLLDIIRLVDVQVAQEELQIIPISYADAAELAVILTQLFASGRIRTAVPGTPPAPTPVAPGPPG